MALLEILIYPDKRLRDIAKPVDVVDAQVHKLLDDMLETMYDAPGIGLAATQVGVNRRVVVIDVSESKDSPMVLINPEILDSSGQQMGEEGCLSIPGIYEDIERSAQIRFRALDRNGESYEMDADGLLGVCVQHEVDHLDGKLFVDYLSALKRNRIRKKMLKGEKPR